MQKSAGAAQRRTEDDAIRILEAGIDAAMPEKALSRVIRGRVITAGRRRIDTRGRAVRLVSFGKAGLSMATAFDSRIRAKDGIVVVPKNVPVPKRSRFDIVRSTHPEPGPASVRAARAIQAYTRQCGGGDLLVFLVSGGGSSLVSLPDGITLEEKVRTNALLLASGANIAETNCVRKHLSAIKGGLMAKDVRCEAVALLMSDVKGNDMSSIASGATYCDRTTFAQAAKVLKKYKLDSKVPRSVTARLRAGIAGRVAETPKRPRIPNVVIASNKVCLAAMKKRAASLGYRASTTTVFGKVQVQASRLAKAAPARPGSCLIFGGETTVRVAGRGRGGRNQELALRIAAALRSDALVASIGTDGIDGNTGFAGAMVRARDTDAAEVRKYLRTSNSAGYLEKFGGHIETGPTQTNLLDIGLMIR